MKDGGGSLDLCVLEEEEEGTGGLGGTAQRGGGASGGPDQDQLRLLRAGTRFLGNAFLPFFFLLLSRTYVLRGFLLSETFETCD